jgi:fimbrial chaperone protein
MRVELSAAAQTAVVTVNNAAEAPVTIQSQVLAWTQVDGKDVYEETRGFIVSPPIFTVAPGAKQIVRIAMRGAPPRTTEQAFRLVFREVPQAEEAIGEGPSFRIALGMNIPMYVAPIGSKGSPRSKFGADAGPDGAPRVRITNEGNGNLRLANLVVTQDDNKLAEQDVFVVLAGATGFIILPGERVLPAKALRVQAQSNAGPVDVSIELPAR